ncbi:hypothetical protein AXG93_3522s1110 [Marchantia polymorpha subsp. ruderalis]|uniref:Uncharacterized protein n=1 Tax=Marchantia polymorpha subsp. ruderalis TaxID=1480154 RepID=A0A176WDV9_MARPO|nr:hypothetical protein AXG93_3522s1110 [Marchantia polymorpha subsp. ruderalis]
MRKVNATTFDFSLLSGDGSYLKIAEISTNLVDNGRDLELELAPQLAAIPRPSLDWSSIIWKNIDLISHLSHKMARGNPIGGAMYGTDMPTPAFSLAVAIALALFQPLPRTQPQQHALEMAPYSSTAPSS